MNGFRRLYAGWKCSRHPGAEVEVIESRAGDPIAAQCRMCFRHFALSPMHYAALSELRRAPAPVTTEELAKRLNRGVSTLGPILRFLVRHGGAVRTYAKVNVDGVQTRRQVFAPAVGESVTTAG